MSYSDYSSAAELVREALSCLHEGEPIYKSLEQVENCLLALFWQQCVRRKMMLAQVAVEDEARSRELKPLDLSKRRRMVI